MTNENNNTNDITPELCEYITNLAGRYAARRGVTSYDDKEDIIGVALLALCEAANTYTDDGRATLRTYAHSMVIFALNKHFRLRRTNTIPIPDKKGRLDRQIHNARDELTKKLFREPTNREVAVHLSLPVEAVRFVTDVCGYSYSSYDTSEDSSDDFLTIFEDDIDEMYVATDDTLSPLKVVLEDERLKKLSEAVDALTTLDQYILCAAYGLPFIGVDTTVPMSQDDLAKKVDASSSWVSRRLALVLSELHATLSSEAT